MSNKFDFSKNEICEILGTKYPLIQGGMAWIADARLAAAVSEAGGLGIITGAQPVELLEKEIKSFREISDKPFGVNIMLMADNVDEVLDICCKYRVPVVTTGAGSPGKYMERLKSCGIKVIPIAPSVAFAKRFERMGADAIIAEGMEAGGHIGQLTTMTLVPQIVDCVNIPVIAAGGIADKRGVRAAFALGASGIQVATRFLASDECRIHENYKNAVVKAKDIDTVITGSRGSHPVRCLKNRFSKSYVDLEKKNASEDELEAFGSGSLRRAVLFGDDVNGSFMAGQSAAMVKGIQPVSEIVADLME